MVGETADGWVNGWVGGPVDGWVNGGVGRLVDGWVGERLVGNPNT